MSVNQQSLQWVALSQENTLVLQLSGELSRNTLLPLWSQHETILASHAVANKHIHWDLSQITRIDSAGFAFLCELLQHSQSVQTVGTNVRLIGAPSQLFTLSDLFGLSTWIKPFLFASN
ncbi:STAS domain-containing protein [Conservatibacter flavescens]|uniref:NTP-binding protein n=1 Tax=Conservatibacter flavescens TaxID=28161 RepID=A0A2M8S0H0_9PAST|nr:STAS domain-containing protein [Conservatibacter flavescens]PJG84625.1 NTP-binding protein [Conservatibacter flavescens]